MNRGGGGARPTADSAVDVEALLRAGESYTVEFKEDVNDDELVHAVVCLANGDGGVLLLGVSDDGRVVGTRARHGELTDPSRVESLVAARTAPNYRVTAEVMTVDDRDVVAIAVPRATGLISTSSGQYVRRALDLHGRPQCLPMPPHEALARLGTLGGVDVSELPLPAATFDDLDESEVVRYRRLAATQGDAILAELATPDLLRALGFMAPEETLTVGAILMFGTTEALQNFVPTHEVVFQVLEHNEVRMNRIERIPLVKAMVELAERIEPYNPQEEIQDGLIRIGLPRYSERAVREIIANALVHRSYATMGQVRVLIDDGTLAVSSEGSFPEGVTTGNILTAPPRPRNPRLADAFKRAGLVDRTGRGVNLVYQGQLRLGRPAPDYSRSTDVWVEVRLSSGPADKELAAFITRLEQSGAVGLPELQVLHEIRQERRITTDRAAALLQLPPDDARVKLNAMVERGLLEARGERRGRTYHLSGAVYRELSDPSGYVRTRGFDPLQHEQMVMTYVREHGSINRGEAAELCQLAPHQAGDLLVRLRSDGRLEMYGQKRWARYRLPKEKA